MRKDVFYEVKHLIHCIMSRGIGIEFCLVPSHCGLYWNEISEKVAKQYTIKNIFCLKYHTITYCFRLMGLLQYFTKLFIKNLKKVNLRYLLVQGI